MVAAIPAIRAATRNAQRDLRGGWSGTSDRAGLRTREALMSIQVALSVSLLVVTGLIGLSLARVLRVDRGFAADRVAAIDLAFPAARYDDEPVRQAAYDRLIQAVRAAPEIESVATTSMLPLRGAGQTNHVVPAGDTRPLAEAATANFRFIAPDYFRTLGMPVVRGRAFTDAERDPHRPAPVLVSSATAARLWPGQDPIGKRFSRGLADEQGFEIVGVTANARTTSLELTPPLMVYVPYWWRSRPAVSLLVKTKGDLAAALPAIRRAVAGVDPEIAIGRTRTIDELVDDSTAGRRYQAQLLAAFGGVALFIAALGVYGVTAYSISRRRREMNIRVALGAVPRQVRGMVVRESSRPLAGGAIGGVAGALALGRLVSGLLFDVRPNDPWIVAGAAGLMGLVGVLASLAAARQGLTLDPALALREE